MFKVFQLFQTHVSNVFIWMLHILLWRHTHVSNVCFHVFQMFQTYVTKVDLNIVYVAMAIHACFKSIFHMF
jgi:hypothetical protein